MKKALIIVFVLFFVSCNLEKSVELKDNESSKQIKNELIQKFFDNLNADEKTKSEKLEMLTSRPHNTTKAPCEIKNIDIEDLSVEDLSVECYVPIYLCYGKDLIPENLKPLGEQVQAVLSKDDVPILFLILERNLTDKSSFLGGKDLIVSFMTDPKGVMLQMKKMKAAIKEAGTNQPFFVRCRSMYGWIENGKIKYIDMNSTDYTYIVKTVE